MRKAQDRGKRGRAQSGDVELCQAALKADKERYRRQAHEVFEEIMAEINPLWRSEEDESEFKNKDALKTDDTAKNDDVGRVAR